MTIHQENINTLWGSVVVEELIRLGVDYFCISPGSRSTPLTVAVARNKKAQSIICIDERAAAFHALGYARAWGKPAVVIATSGTAIANFFPAVVEASVAMIPLLVLSADRPPELRETGANQTIRQAEIFGSYPRWSFDLPCPNEEMKPEALLGIIDQAVYRSQNSPRGPVHLNFMFREPLAPFKKEISSSYLALLDKWLEKKSPQSQYHKPLLQIEENKFTNLVQLIEKEDRGLLVLGAMCPSLNPKQIIPLVHKLKWPVLADVNSSFRLEKELLPYLIHFDQMLLSHEREEYIPNTILQIGSNVTSKRFLEFTTQYPPQNYIICKEDPSRHDPQHRVTEFFEVSLENFIQKLNQKLSSKRTGTSWSNKLCQISAKVAYAIDLFWQSGKGSLSEGAIAYKQTQLLPEEAGLFLASSMPIRYIDMYALASNKENKLAANRGASGIDGTIASASGFAVALQKPVSLLIGDLAFLHDLNSLSLLRELSVPLVITILNNHGGGIFSLLPVAQFESFFPRYFATEHPFRFAQAAEMFGLEYHAPKNLSDFTEIYSHAFQKSTSTIIEVEVEQSDNPIWLKGLQEEIYSALQRKT